MKYRLVFVLLITSVIFVGRVVASDVYVNIANASGPWDGTIDHPWNTIQQGLDDPNLQSGNTVWIFDGVYSGSGNISLSVRVDHLTIRSLNGDPELCIIDCSYSGWGIRISGNSNRNATIRDLTIKKANSSAIDCRDNADDLLVSNCILTENYGGSGAAIYCGSHRHQMQNCKIYRNYSYMTGSSAVYITGFQTLSSIEGCEFIENVSEKSAGALKCNSTYLAVSNSIFKRNICLYYGNVTYTDCPGAIFGSMSSLTVTNCVFQQNIGSVGGALSVLGGNHPTDIVNCLFTENIAQSGGAIGFSSNYPATVVNCTIMNNYAYNQSHGGAVDCSQSNPNFINTIFWNNSTPAGINHFYTYSSTPVASYCDFQGGCPSDVTCTNCLDVDPDFIGDDRGHLRQGSPCIDQGTGSGAPSTDIDQETRPSGSGYDIGCDEFTYSTGDTCDSAFEISSGASLNDISTAGYSDSAGELTACGYAGSDIWFELNDRDLAPDTQVTVTLSDEQITPPGSLNISLLNGCDPDADCLLTATDQIIVNYTSGPIYILVDGGAGSFDLSVSHEKTDVYVDSANDCPGSGSVTNPFCCIQDGINAVSSGGTVWLADAVFEGPGNMNLQIIHKTCSIRSISDSYEECQLDTQGFQKAAGFFLTLLSEPGITIQGIQFLNFTGRIVDARRVENLSLQGCSFVDNMSDILNYLSGSSTIESCIFSENEARSIYGDSGDIHVMECFFGENSTTNTGGCIYLRGTGSIDVQNSSFINNHSDGDGGAVAVINNYTQTYANSIFSNNTSGNRGGALFFNTSLRDAQLMYCSLSGNTAAVEGGALACVGSEDVLISSSIFWQNHATVANNEILGNNRIVASACVITSSCPDDVTCYALYTTDPSLVGDDLLHIRSDSICIDNGIASGAPSIDYDGENRPAASGYDIGADEYSDIIGDDCTHCFSIGCETEIIHFDTTDYSDDVPDLSDCGYTGNDVWFKIDSTGMVPGTEVTCTLTNEMISGDFFISMLSGCDPDDDCLTTHTTAAQAHFTTQDLYVLVDGGIGTFDLEINCIAPSPTPTPTSSPTSTATPSFTPVPTDTGSPFPTQTPTIPPVPSTSVPGLGLTILILTAVLIISARNKF